MSCTLSRLSFASAECMCILHCHRKEHLPECKGLPCTKMQLQTSEYASSSREGSAPWKAYAGASKAKLKGSLHFQFFGAQNAQKMLKTPQNAHWKTHPHTFRTFCSIHCLLIYKIAHGKRVANIFGYENSNSPSEESLLESTLSSARYSHSLSLQALIYAFLLKRSLAELSIYPFYTTIFFYHLTISEFFLFQDLFPFNVFNTDRRSQNTTSIFHSMLHFVIVS